MAWVNLNLSECNSLHIIIINIIIIYEFYLFIYFNFNFFELLIDNSSLSHHGDPQYKKIDLHSATLK